MRSLVPSCMLFARGSLVSNGEYGWDEYSRSRPPIEVMQRQSRSFHFIAKFCCFHTSTQTQRWLFWQIFCWSAFVFDIRHRHLIIKHNKLDEFMNFLLIKLKLRLVRFCFLCSFLVLMLNFFRWWSQSFQLFCCSWCF